MPYFSNLEALLQKLFRLKLIAVYYYILLLNKIDFIHIHIIFFHCTSIFSEVKFKLLYFFNILVRLIKNKALRLSHTQSTQDIFNFWKL